MNILGINAYHGDASVALVKDGQLVGAMEEERLNRRKHCAGFPGLAAKAVLAAAGSRRPSWITWRCRAIPRPTSTRRSVRDPEAPILHQAGEGSPGQRRQGARRRRGAGRRPGGRGRRALKSQVPRRRAPQVPHLEHVLRFAVRGRGLSVDRRLRRFRFDDARRGARIRKLEILDRIELPPALGRPLLHRRHAVHRLSLPLRRRGQGDGAGPLRQAALPRRVPPAHPPAPRRRLRADRQLLPPRLARASR